MNNQTVRQFTHIILASQLVVFSVLYWNSIERGKTLEDLLPKEIQEVAFNEELMQFMSTRPNAVAQEAENGSPNTYLEPMHSEDITSIIYYFDAEQPRMPLYEVVVNFKDEVSMELHANILLGSSNHTGKDGHSKEWTFDLNGGHILHCSTFENKIVYKMPISNTERNASKSKQ